MKKYITVIDSIMGSGKTEYMMAYMNKNQNKNYMFVTPYLSELDRLKRICPWIYSPSNDGKKTDELKNLLLAGKPVGITHALFERIPSNFLPIIEKGNYTLVLDESINVIEPVSLKRDDFTVLKMFSDCDKNNKVNFDLKKHFGKNFYSGSSAFLKSSFNRMKNDNLYMVNDSYFVNLFNNNVFSVFDSIYLLTYLYEGQLISVYFKFYDYGVQKYSIDSEYKLCDYSPLIKTEKQKISQLIDICEDNKLNEIGIRNNRSHPFSQNWLTHLDENDCKHIRLNMNNFFRNKHGAKSNNIMWTTYLGPEDSILNKLKGRGFTKGFLNCAAKATNEYSNHHYLAYLINRFVSPQISYFLKEKGCEFNQDKWALSEMIQWIWRSAIRKYEKVCVYVPSERMRYLFYEWINS